MSQHESSISEKSSIDSYNQERQHIDEILLTQLDTLILKEIRIFSQQKNFKLVELVSRLSSKNRSFKALSRVLEEITDFSLEFQASLELIKKNYSSNVSALSWKKGKDGLAIDLQRGEYYKVIRNLLKMMNHSSDYEEQDSAKVVTQIGQLPEADRFFSIVGFHLPIQTIPAKDEQHIASSQETDLLKVRTQESLRDIQCCIDKYIKACQKLSAIDLSLHFQDEFERRIKDLEEKYNTKRTELLSSKADDRLFNQFYEEILADLNAIFDLFTKGVEQDGQKAQEDSITPYRNIHKPEYLSNKNCIRDEEFSQLEIRLGESIYKARSVIPCLNIPIQRAIHHLREAIDAYCHFTGADQDHYLAQTLITAAISDTYPFGASATFDLIKDLFSHSSPQNINFIREICFKVGADGLINSFASSSIEASEEARRLQLIRCLTDLFQKFENDRDRFVSLVEGLISYLPPQVMIKIIECLSNECVLGSEIIQKSLMDYCTKPEAMQHDIIANFIGPIFSKLNPANQETLRTQLETIYSEELMHPFKSICTERAGKKKSVVIPKIHFLHQCIQKYFEHPEEFYLKENNQTTLFSLFDGEFEFPSYQRQENGSLEYKKGSLKPYWLYKYILPYIHDSDRKKQFAFKLIHGYFQPVDSFLELDKKEADKIVVSKNHGMAVRLLVELIDQFPDILSDDNVQGLIHNPQFRTLALRYIVRLLRGDGHRLYEYPDRTASCVRINEIFSFESNPTELEEIAKCYLHSALIIGTAEKQSIQEVANRINWLSMVFPSSLDNNTVIGLLSNWREYSYRHKPEILAYLRKKTKQDSA